ncbi:MAG: hypothetical protein ACREGR_00710 [Minisyncoccia bacterium]
MKRQRDLGRDVDKYLPTGGDTNMAVHKKTKESARASRIAKRTMAQQSRWYKCQQFASVLYHSHLSDDTIDYQIDTFRHQLAESIPPRGEVE